MDLSKFISLLVNSVVFSVIGVITFLTCFFIVDKLTPGDLWLELVERKNSAVAIFFGCLAIGMSLIIAACLHG
jgi:uncharacterized membrane protein YjfL (UPF0719 family)